MQTSIKKFFIVLISLIAFGCSNDSPNDLTIPTPLPELVSFSRDVQPILTSNCISCHSNPPTNGAPIALTTKSLVENAIVTKGLIDRIMLNETDPNFMPLSGSKLSEANINIIKKWQTDGFKD